MKVLFFLCVLQLELIMNLLIYIFIVCILLCVIYRLYDMYAVRTVYTTIYLKEQQNRH
jgi:hypothetical protein